MSPAGRRRLPPRADQAGFTLLELLVALTLAGLILALVPALTADSRDRAALARDADLVRASLALARTQAVTQAVPVEFSPGSRLAAWVAMIPAVIRFLPDGSSSGGTLILDNPAGRRTLRIDPLTGAVVMESGG